MRVLLIRLRLIGDVVFVTPAIRALANRVPGIKLTVLIEPEVVPIVAKNPHVSEIIIARRSIGITRLRDDLSIGLQIRSSKFDAVIDFHGGPRSAWFTWASHAPVRIGYALKGRQWIYNRLVDRPKTQRARHSVENQWDLLSQLDRIFAKPPSPYHDAVEMVEDPEAVNRAARHLAAAGINEKHKIIVLHVSAGNPFRRWPGEFFIDLAVSLATADKERRIIVVSGPSDMSAAIDISEAVRSKLGTRDKAVIGIAQLDLSELRAVIARAVLFIGGDSGPLHIAATTQVPIVGIYGPTLPVRSAPWRDPLLTTESVDIGSLPCRPCNQRVCEPGDFRCLSQLSPDVVIAAAERAIAKSYE